MFRGLFPKLFVCSFVFLRCRRRNPRKRREKGYVESSDGHTRDDNICSCHSYYIHLWKFDVFLFKLHTNVMRSSKMSLNSEKIKLSFHFHCMPQFHSCITLQTSSKLSIRFQRYSYFSDAQNNKIQRKLNAIIGSI